MSEITLTLDQLAQYPRPGNSVPHALQFTPDGQQLGYLFAATGTLTQGLWLQEVSTGVVRQIQIQATGEADSGRALSLEEELRRERNRVRESGITSFQFGQDALSGDLLILFPFNGEFYMVRGASNPAKLELGEGATNARLSPDGAHLAFIRDDQLFVLSLDQGATARCLTPGAEDGITNGLAEYIAQEEMGRSEGYWWSPDGLQIAYERVDSSPIASYPIVHQGTERFSLEEHRYPFVGGANAVVSVGIVPITGEPSDVKWMDLGAEPDSYLARVHWRPDGVLTAQIQSRDQRLLRLVSFDSISGVATTLLEERGEPWLNLHDNLRYLQTGEFLWSSENTGFQHLSLHAQDGEQLRPLTEGSWVVTGQVTVDEARRTVYFQGTREGVTERHLYTVSLDSGPIRRVTPEQGWHDTVLSPSCTVFADTWSNRGRSPRVTLRGIVEGEQLAVLHDNQGLLPSTVGLVLPELTSFSTKDGVVLHAAIYATEATRLSTHPHPLIVSVYGGSAAQIVMDHWSLTVDLRAQYLAQQGFVVLKVDNRGTPNRGVAFEAPVAGMLGHAEVDDQVEGVRFLANRSYVDAERVGIYGWSYGGYMTLRALQRAPGIFKVGVAGAPVTFWDGYDTHYTERYMRQLRDNAEGYRASSVLPYVDAISGQLMIVHGMVDENVHARHTMRLITALTAAGKQYELVVFPEARHMPRAAADLRYLEERLVEFFRRHLL